MIYWCFISGYILVSSISVNALQPAKCTHEKTADGLKLSVCTIQSLAAPYADTELPNDIPYDVEVIHIHNVIQLYVNENTFSKFGDLKEIFMKLTFIVDPHFIPKSQEWFDHIHKSLFANTNVEKITITECNLQTMNKFKYPSTIKSLNLSNNYYTWITFEDYQDLEEVDLKNNRLLIFPTFSYPPPPLSYLNVQSNKFKNITVHDLAALCWLKELEINTDGTNLHDWNGICECRRVLQWSSEIKLNLLNFYCWPAIEAELEAMNCSSYTLLEARKIREKCIISNTGVSFVYRRLFKEKFKYLTYLLILILICFLAYVGYKIYDGSITKPTWESKTTAPYIPSTSRTPSTPRTGRTPTTSTETDSISEEAEEEEEEEEESIKTTTRIPSRRY